ncbi:MAG: hypothetical protein DRO11_05855 [Methanobacteriota archaeon]|nr:MAG: hypothetical protein DRO11_05855 [Euryarchaeota archaeon]
MALRAAQEVFGFSHPFLDVETQLEVLFLVLLFTAFNLFVSGWPRVEAHIPLLCPGSHGPGGGC